MDQHHRLDEQRKLAQTLLTLEHIRQVVRVVCWREIGEDVAQGVVERLLEKGVPLDTPLSFVRIKHLAFDEMRKLRRQELPLLEDSTEPEAAPAGVSKVEEVEAVVDRIMEGAQLTLEEAALVYHHYYLAESFSVMAVSFDVSVSDVSRWHAQALAKLRKAAEEYDCGNADTD